MMKKLRYFLLTIFSFLLLVPSTYATEGTNPFELSWDTGYVDTYNYMSYGTLVYQDKVFVYNTEAYEYTLELLDKDGNVIKSNTIDCDNISNSATDGEYIYLIAEGFYDDAYADIELLKLDSNLKIVNHIAMPIDYPSNSDFTLIANMLGLNTMSANDGNVAILVPEYVYVIGRDLSQWTIMNFTKEACKLFFPEFYSAFELTDEMPDGPQPDEKYFMFHFYEGDETVRSGYIYDEDFSIQNGVIQRLDTNDNVIFELISDEYKLFTHVEVVGDYVVAIETSREGSYSTELLVIDKSGNIVYRETFSNLLLEQYNIAYTLVDKTPDGFIVTEYLNKYRDHSIMTVVPQGAFRTRKFVLPDNVPYNISTRTDGNGTVTPSVTEAYPDEEVTFVVTPNEGYKVAYVKVTDANGKEVYFPGNKFTMPHADVTIEAAFTIENPKTGAKIGAITFGVLLLTVPALVTRKRKDKLFNV